MRKQTKWAVILGAAAVMTLGASMTSFAATGWVEEGGEWYYYNKDEESVTDKWQKSNDGNNYYLGDDGAMVTSSWVEGEDTKYYVNSYGARCVNEWRYMYAEDDSSSDEENWYYFDANGKMAKTKKTINGKTYYFDADGIMLTGWLASASGSNEASKLESEITDEYAYYCDENGQRISGWIKLYAPEDTEEDEEQYWYNFKSEGKIRRNARATINSKAYVFNNEGQMLSGWIHGDSTTSYVAIDNDNTDVEIASALSEMDKFLFAGGENDGAIKKNVWVNSVQPGDNAEDSDEDKEWYYLAKDGTVYFAGGEYVDMDAPAYKVPAKLIGTRKRSTDSKDDIKVGFKKVGTSKTYAFDEEGKMISGLVETTALGPNGESIGFYYFGKSNDGAMKTTGVTTLVDDDDVSHSYYFASRSSSTAYKGQGVTGVQSNKLYVNGLVVAADEGSKYQVVEVDVLGDSVFAIVSPKGVITTSSSTVTDDNGRKYRNGTKTGIAATVGFGYDVVYTVVAGISPDAPATAAHIIVIR